MINRIAALALLASGPVNSAHAYCLVTSPDGSVSHWCHPATHPERFLLVLGVIILLFVLACFSFRYAWTQTFPRGRQDALDTVEYLDNQADRARALTRKLDAEAKLIDSYINTARKQAERAELPQILQHDKTVRKMQSDLRRR